MFSKLKEKFGKLIKKISKGEEDLQEKEEPLQEQEGEQLEEQKEQEEKLEEEKEKVEEREQREEKKEEIEEEQEEKGEKRKEIEEKEKENEEKESKKEGFFERLRKKELSEEEFNKIFEEIELELFESNVAFEVIEKIKQDLKTAIVGKKFNKKEFEDVVKTTLKNSIIEILDQGKIDLLELSEKHKPLVISFFGINGAGKTTTIAKIANLFLQKGKSVIMAASDTYRAASIEQLEEHAKKLGVRVIKHKYGADPAAVAYDAVSHAKAKGIDVVLIDTAGRMHSNKNLMEELKKIVRVVQPHVKIFVAEAITGNDAVVQAETFEKEIGIDGVIITKADIDEKGGCMLSIAYTIKKPIIYLGVGQEYKDLKIADPEDIANSIIM